MKKSVFIIFSLLSLFSCNVHPKSNNQIKKTEIKLLSWNLETFFDANYDGNEYPDFSKTSSGWNQLKYENRLNNLISVLKTIDTDIVVFQELEKENQLYDISNKLFSVFSFSKVYGYGAFAKEKDSAIGCGILSRYPILNVTVHSVCIKTKKQQQPSLRPIMEVLIKKGNSEFCILVNHWKSKSGGEENTKIWRNYQEIILADRINKLSEKGIPFVACGDFNKDIKEFEKIINSDGYVNILLKGSKNAYVTSPWYNLQGELIEPGSYYYKKSWGRIDHFFYGKNIELVDFTVETNGPWKSSAGTPLRYFLKNGKGYSDHFPISCKIRV